MSKARTDFIFLEMPAVAHPIRMVEVDWDSHGSHEALGLTAEGHAALGKELERRKDTPGDNTATWKGPRPGVA